MEESPATASETPPLTVHVELTVEDVSRAHFWTLFQLPAIRALIGVNALLFLSFLILAIRALVRQEQAMAFAAGVPLLLLIFAAFPLQVRRRARSHFASLTTEQRRGTYTFTEEGFAWTLGHAPGSAPWEAVTVARETDDYVFLMTPSGRTHVLPKRCLGGDAPAILQRWQPRRAESRRDSLNSR